MGCLYQENTKLVDSWRGVHSSFVLNIMDKCMKERKRIMDYIVLKWC
jgi:hypothetical protein